MEIFWTLFYNPDHCAWEGRLKKSGKSCYVIYGRPHRPNFDISNKKWRRLQNTRTFDVNLGGFLIIEFLWIFVSKVSQGLIQFFQSNPQILSFTLIYKYTWYHLSKQLQFWHFRKTTGYFINRTSIKQHCKSIQPIRRVATGRVKKAKG